MLELRTTIWRGVSADRFAAVFWKGSKEECDRVKRFFLCWQGSPSRHSGTSEVRNPKLPYQALVIRTERRASLRVFPNEDKRRCGTLGQPRLAGILSL